MSPNGSYIVFQSTRPKVPLTDATRPKSGEPIPGIASNLWRVDLRRLRMERAEAALLFRLQEWRLSKGQPLAFSDGNTMDVDPEIAPDGLFLVFVSAGRMPGNAKDHLFVVLKKE